MYPYNPYQQPPNPNSNPYAYYNLSGGKGHIAPGMMGGSNPMGNQPTYSGWNNPTQGSSSPWNDPGRSQNPLENIAAMFGGGQGSAGNWAQLGSGLGSLLSMFGLSQQGNMPNPADSAMPYLNNISGTLKPYYDPYIQAGHKAMGNLENEYGQLLGDPGAKLNRIGQSFQQSPGFAFQTQQATNAANNAAAAGGMLGSPQEQQSLAQAVNGIASQDYDKYLTHATGLYGKGLEGEQGLNLLGFNASNEMAQALMSQLMSQAQLSYSGQANQNQAQGQQSGAMWGQGASAISSLLPLLLAAA